MQHQPSPGDLCSATSVANSISSQIWRQSIRDRLEVKLNTVLQQLAEEIDQDIQVSGCLFVRNIRNQHQIACSFLEDRIYTFATSHNNTGNGSNQRQPSHQQINNEKSTQHQQPQNNSPFTINHQNGNGQFIVDESPSSSSTNNHHLPYLNVSKNSNVVGNGQQNCLANGNVNNGNGGNGATDMTVDHAAAVAASLQLVKSVANTSGFSADLLNKLTQDVRRTQHQQQQTAAVNKSKQHHDHKPPSLLSTVNSLVTTSPSLTVDIARILQQKLSAATASNGTIPGNQQSIATTGAGGGPMNKHLVRRKIKREMNQPSSSTDLNNFTSRVCKRESTSECGWTGPYSGPIPEFVQSMEPLDLTQLYESFRAFANSNDPLDPPLGDPKQFVRLMTRRVLFNDTILRLSTTSGGNEFPPLNPERMACLHRLFTELRWGSNENQADWQDAKKSIRQYCKYLRLRSPLSSQEREFCKQLWLRGQSIV
ncbi:hypothetical protein GJ496_011670 [Pomphorhynchus laevis]|nr:hypothetical protein GJ496_011670 [Pomphorhynchus laevis]